MRYIRKIISKVWKNTYLRQETIWYNLVHGRIIATIIILGILFCGMHEQYQREAIELKTNLNIAIFDGWKETADGRELYLNIYMDVNTVPFVFTKEDIFNMVSDKVKTHNFWVESAKANRRAGIYVKPDAREEHKIKAIYLERDSFLWKTHKTVWLISDNTELAFDLRKELQEKGEIIPLED